ncbi:endonuclease/exonuclease/phosphatase family protein [Candidatus Woesearchaeota archaeon]|nr:endonuclease/exonuclease/phosphatase family protein [Candidatus Woesearchaeota archaeon]
MKLTLLFSNAANFRGSHTMNFRRYWKHHLSLHVPENKENLEELVGLVQSTGADVVGLCEVDRCAHWSGKIDQPKYLAERLGFDYCYAQNYRSPAPFIYTADTGNAVLSRFRIDKFSSGKRTFKRRHFYEIISKPVGSKEFLHAQYYLPNGRMLHVVCTHLATNFQSLRGWNAHDIVDYFKRNIVPLHEKCGDSYIFMGDLNTVPLYTKQRCGFNDSSLEAINADDGFADKFLKKVTQAVEYMFPEDYRNDRTLWVLKDSGLFKSTMALDPFNPNLADISPELYGTYPQKPNRMIDYIFVSPDITTTDIIPIEVGFSDHKAIKTVVELPER